MDMPAVQPLELGEITTPDWHPLPGQVVKIRAFLIEHHSGPILFETGVGSGNAFIEREYQPRVLGVRDQLAAHGITIDEVRLIVNSHLHFDHCGLNRLFPETPIVVQRAEWEAAQAERYTVPDWVRFAGATYRHVAGDLDLADGVRVVATPGHSPGHQSLVVESGRGLEVLVGQAAEDFADYRARVRDDASLGRLAASGPSWLHFSHGESVEAPGPLS